MDFPSSVVNLHVIMAKYAEIEAVKAEIRSMEVKNHERRQAEMADAYGEECFNSLSQTLYTISGELARL